MKLKRNLVNATLENLIEPPLADANYIEHSQLNNDYADRIAVAVSNPPKTDVGSHHKAVVQGLFEGEFLSTEERDFGFDTLIAYAVGIKMFYALDAFNELFDMLVAGGYTDPLLGPDKLYNSSGDNYYSAMSFVQTPDDTEMSVARMRPNKKDDDEIRQEWVDKAIKRDVIFVENQGPSWCYVLERSMFGGDPKKLFILRLKKEYDSPCKLQEVIDREASFDGYDFDWSCNNGEDARIIATLDIDGMECKEGWWDMKRIEHTLHNLYAGRDALREDSKHVQE